VEVALAKREVRARRIRVGLAISAVIIGSLSIWAGFVVGPMMFMGPFIGCPLAVALGIASLIDARNLSLSRSTRATAIAGVVIGGIPLLFIVITGILMSFSPTD